MPPAAAPVNREPPPSVTAELRNEISSTSSMVSPEQGCAQRAGSINPGPQTPAHNTMLATGLEASPPTSDHVTGSSTIRLRAQQMVSGIRRIVSCTPSARLSSAPTVPIQASLSCEHISTTSLGDNITTAPPPPSCDSLQHEHPTPPQPASASSVPASAFAAAASHHRAVSAAFPDSRSGLAAASSSGASAPLCSSVEALAPLCGSSIQCTPSGNCEATAALASDSNPAAPAIDAAVEASIELMTSRSTTRSDWDIAAFLFGLPPSSDIMRAFTPFSPDAVEHVSALLDSLSSAESRALNDLLSRHLPSTTAHFEDLLGSALDSGSHLRPALSAESYTEAEAAIARAAEVDAIARAAAAAEAAAHEASALAAAETAARAADDAHRRAATEATSIQQLRADYPYLDSAFIILIRSIVQSRGEGALDALSLVVSDWISDHTDPVLGSEISVQHYLHASQTAATSHR